LLSQFPLDLNGCPASGKILQLEWVFLQVVKLKCRPGKLKIEAFV